MATVHALSFPGLFSPTGLLAAGPQTTAWLYMFWHGVFPLCVIAYCLLQGRDGSARVTQGSASTLILTCLGAVLAAVLAFSALATAGHDWLPAIMQKHQYTTAMLTVVSSVWALSVIALGLLWWWRRPHCVLDVWLLVVMCAWIFDIALSAVLNAGRFDLGFYTGRIYGLLAASFVLVVLLLENGTLYAKLVEALEGERAKSLQLAHANKELDAFSYSISHDLGAPLRAISGFTAILRDEHGASLAPGGRDALDRIARNGQRMGQMIEDLLRFSRCGRQPLAKVHVDVSALVSEVVAELREQQPGRSIDVSIASLPYCVGDPSLLRQVFVNLLSNAFKFTRETPQARIEVGFAEFAFGPAYFVRDNGAGFDMRYAERLFNVFTRLHRSTQYEGTGVGLSIVQRIVERHGGRIGFDAKPKEGACFYFSIPGAGRTSAP
jgi:signal transduction histidine kinase